MLRHLLPALAGILCLAAQPALATSPKGKTYSVTLYSSFNTKFDDCFAFGKNGSLIIQGFGPMIYRFGELNAQSDSWQALSRPSAPFGLTFHGVSGGAGAQTLQGNGLNVDGDTFVLLGVPDPNCNAASAERRAGSYRR